MQDSAATVIVSQHKLAGQAHELADAAVAGGAGAHPAVLLIEDVAAGIGSEVEGSLAPVEDLSVGYCMFTSGSTVRHRAGRRGRRDVGGIPRLCLAPRLPRLPFRPLAGLAGLLAGLLAGRAAARPGRTRHRAACSPAARRAGPRAWR